MDRMKRGTRIDFALTFAEVGFPIFPVNVFRRGERWRKVPHVADWANAATVDPEILREWWLRWPLAMPGLPLERCGLVVVDADRHGGVDGVEAFRQLGLMPRHPVVTTKSGGEHHWFRQPAQRITFAKWAGGEVLGIGRFVVGYALPQGECPELPEVFCAGRAKPAINRNRKLVCPPTDGVVVSDLTAALRKMDPVDWRGDWDRWFQLMTACKGVRDDEYAGDGEEIARQWHSVVPRHRGALYAALKARGIKVRRSQQRNIPVERTKQFADHGGRPLTLSGRKRSNRDFHFQHATMKPRIDGLLARLQRMASEQELFNSACFMAELTSMPQRDARGLLEQAVKDTALWAQLGRDGVRKTIERGFAHIERKAMASA
jgi:hypothetical protein